MNSEQLNTLNPLEGGIELATPSPAKAEAALKIMNNMVSTGQITKAGAAWLKVGVDPWHDNKITDFKGIPNNYGGNSVCMSVVQEVDITKPSSLPPGNWGCKISTQPIASSIPMVRYNFVGNAGAKTAATLLTTMWPVSVDFAQSGTDFPEWGDLATSVGVQIPQQYLQGPYQVAGMGVEVVNTTAELQKQGLFTGAIMNQNSYVDFTSVLYDDAVNWAPVSLFPVRTTPKNLAEAILLPGTCQWEAKEGCYGVVQLLGVASRPPTAVPTFPIWTDTDFSVAPTVNAWRAPLLTLTAVPPLVAPKVIPATNCGHVPMNSSVFMFTGLSEQSTLTLRVRWILERFPNDNEPDIVVLSNPSASWDPVALEIYSRLMRKLPPAVMFKMNPKGEWWKVMLAGIADVASAGLLLMPHPLAKGAGAALAAARQILAPETQSKQKQIAPAPSKPKPIVPVQKQQQAQPKKKRKRKNPAS